MSIDLEFFLKFIGGIAVMAGALIAWGARFLVASQEQRFEERLRAMEKQMGSLEKYFESHFKRQADLHRELHEVKIHIAKQGRTESELGRQMEEILAEIRRGR